MSIPDELLFDKRVIEQHLRTGVVTEEEYARYLKKLKDLAPDTSLTEAKLTPLGKQLPSGVIDEDDEL